MERPGGLGSLAFDDMAVMEDDKEGDALAALSAQPAPRALVRSPMMRTRSLSDGGGTPAKLSPSPLIVEASRRTAKDDSAIKESCSTPVTPHRAEFPRRGLSLQMPRDFTPPAHPSSSSSSTKPAPLSPKLDHSQIYASPTNILPRRSRGLDFSRAATSLHHSTLAESSPDSSPTIGGRGMSIPNRRSGDYGGPEQSSTSLWSIMGNQERMHIPSSIGSSHPLASDSSSTSDDDDLMDEDMDDTYITTPQVSKSSTIMGPQTTAGPPWIAGGSPAVNSLLSFKQRQRPRKQPKKKLRGPLGLGFNPSVAAGLSGLSMSPPTNITKDVPGGHSRRESISWQANQLHISGTGSEGEDNGKNGDGIDSMGTPSRDGQRPNVIRRVVTRRGNLLPKTKNFARIRAALAEESAPVESEFLREAEVVRQVRESDRDLEPRMPPAPALSTATTTHSSPNMATESLDDIPEDDMMADSGLRLSSSFKQQVLKNSKGKTFWDTFSESSSIGTRTTPPPPPILPRGSSSGVSEDVSMDSPSLAATAAFVNGLFPSNSDSQRSETPQPSQAGPLPPSAAEITRRINNKRRRDDDFDPVSFKRRAVSPGMSLNNSPVMQSPLQRDVAPWGSRPGSNGGDKGGSGTASESGSLGGTPGAAPNGSQGANGRPNGNKGRVGYQGMVDTNDGMMRMSIE